VFLVLQVAFTKKWSIIITLLALAASLIPFGTFIADKKIFSKAE
jgi:integral membrane protein